MATKIRDKQLRNFDPVRDASLTADKVFINISSSSIKALDTLYVHITTGGSPTLQPVSTWLTIVSGRTIKDLLKGFEKGKIKLSTTNILPGSFVDKDCEAVVEVNQTVIFQKQPSSSLRNVHGAIDSGATKFTNNDNYIMIDLGKDVPIKYVKKSEIMCGDVNLLSFLDGATDMDFDEFIEKISGKKLTYNGIEISALYLEKEYDATSTVLAEEKINTDSFEVETNVLSNFVDETGISRTAGSTFVSETAEEIDKTFAEVSACEIEVSTLNGVVKRPGFKSSLYSANKNGEYIKIRIKGENFDSFVPISAVQLPTGKSSLDQVDVGTVLKIKLGDAEVETQPITVEQKTVRYKPLNHFEKSSGAMSDSSFLRLKDGRYVQEQKAVQPISYKESTSVADAYLVKVGTQFLIIAKATFESVGYTTDGGVTVTTADTAMYKKLERCEFGKDAQYVQTESVAGSAVNKCDAIRHDTTFNTIEDLNKVREKFLESYKAGNYALDKVYADGNLEELDSSDRFILTNEVIHENTVSRKGDLACIKNNPVTFSFDEKTGQIQLVKGGPSVSWRKSTKEGYKTLGKTVGLGMLGLCSGPGGLLVAMALAPVVVVAGAGAVLSLGIIPAWNFISTRVKNGKALPDLMKKHQDSVAKDLKSQLEKIHNDLKATNLTEDVIVGKINILCSDINTLSTSKFDDRCVMKDGVMNVTPENASRVSEMQIELKNAVKRDSWMGRNIGWMRYLLFPAWGFAGAIDGISGKFGKKAGLAKYFSKNKIELLTKNLDEKKAKLIKAYNKLVRDDEKIKDIDASMHDAIKAKVGDTSKVWKNYEKAFNDKNDLDKELKAIIKKYSEPSDRNEHEQKDEFIAKAENLKLYALIRNQMVKKGIAGEDKITYDINTGKILVGNKELVREGDNIKTVPLTAETIKLLSDEAKLVATVNVDVGVLADITTEAQDIVTTKLADKMAPEQVDADEVSSIESVILDFEGLNEEYLKLKKYAYGLEDLKKKGKISNTFLDSEKAQILTDVKNKKICDEVKGRIELLKTNYAEYEKQKEQIDKNANHKKLFTYIKNTLESEAFGYVEELGNKEIKEEIEKEYVIVSDFIEALDKVIVDIKAGTLDITSAHYLKVEDALTYNRVPTPIKNSIQNLRNYNADYDAHKTYYDAFDGFRDLFVDVKAIIATDYAKKFESYETATNLTSVKNVKQVITTYIESLDHAIWDLVTTGKMKSTEAYFALLKDDIKKHKPESIESAMTDLKNAYADYETKKEFYDAQGYEILFKEIKVLIDTDFLAKFVQIKEALTKDKSEAKEMAKEFVESKIDEVEDLFADIDVQKAILDGLKSKTALSPTEQTQWDNAKNEIAVIYGKIDSKFVDLSKIKDRDLKSKVIYLQNKYTALKSTISKIKLATPKPAKDLTGDPIIISESKLKTELSARNPDLVNYLRSKISTLQESDIDEIVQRINEKHANSKTLKSILSRLGNKNLPEIYKYGQEYLTKHITNGVVV